MSVLRRRLSALALSCIWPIAAHASTPLTASEILGQYNLVTSGNVSSTSDIGGATVIGGTLSGSNTFLMGTTPSQSKSVSVYGGISQTSNININNGGNLYYSGTGSLSGTVNFNGGSWVKSGPSLPLSDYITPLDNVSSSLADLTDTSSISLGNNTLGFNAVAGSGGLAVFDISASTLQTDFQNTSNIAFNFGQGVTTAVVNVTGGSFSQPSNSNWNGSGLTNVLFNFTNATQVQVGH